MSYVKQLKQLLGNNSYCKWARKAADVHFMLGALLFPSMRYICIILTLLASSAIAEVITLPITKGYVPLTLDGQSFNVLMDTGTARSFVMYGPTYEEANGKGSCSNLPSGCYFCPDDNPCDDILVRYPWEVSFGNDDEYVHVKHHVTLIIGTTIIDEFMIGLAIKYSGKAPHGYLGLSFGRGYLPKTALDQLKQRGIIDDLAYTIHIDGSEDGMSGELSLGDVKLVNKHPLRMDSRPGSRYNQKTAVKVSMVTIVDIDDIPYSERADNFDRERSGAPIAVDSGASVVDVPLSTFNLINEIVTDMIIRNEGEMAVAALGDNKMIWSDLERHWAVVRKEHTKYLPTIVYCIRGKTTRIELRVEPKHYIVQCNDVTCDLAIGPVPDGECPVLGQPLFRAYKMGFNLSKKQLYFSSDAIEICQHKFGWEKYFAPGTRLRRWSDACANGLNIYLRLPT